jgi:hypothetical protein
MKNIMYHYNGIQDEEELHDDEVMEKLVVGQIVERAGRYWKIADVETVLVVSDPERIDVVKVFLAGPQRRRHSKI